jgi:hypothetical protein
MRKWVKWTWTELYEDYILPTNWATKNPLYLKVWTSKVKDQIRDELETGDEKKDLKTRLKHSKNFWIIHSLAGVWMIVIDLKDWDVDILIVFLNIIINIYPILVQVNTHQRINKILWFLENKS